MKIQEAINVLKKYTNASVGLSKVVITAHAMAITALEKQILRKPLMGGNTDKYTGDIFICPSCSGIVGVDDERATYCADCGQALDWK